MDYAKPLMQAGGLAGRVVGQKAPRKPTTTDAGIKRMMAMSVFDAAQEVYRTWALCRLQGSEPLRGHHLAADRHAKAVEALCAEFDVLAQDGKK